MIRGWRNNPLWVKHYEDVKKQRFDKRKSLLKLDMEIMAEELRLKHANTRFEQRPGSVIMYEKYL